jgi:hypothetical protein
MTQPRLIPGAPGIYEAVASAKPRFTGTRMDVAAFVGVAPRGPARVPRLPETWRADRPCVGPEFTQRRSLAVPVESWAEYRRLFGGFDGPGRLPYAVRSFFDQGGKRAYVVRIVHEYADDAKNRGGVATGAVARAVARDGNTDLPLRLHARDEGRWGDRLRAAIGFSLLFLGPWSFDQDHLIFAAGVPLSVGALLRLRGDAGAATFAFIADLRREPGERLRVTLDRNLGFTPTAIEVVEAALELDDGDGHRERHERLGLSAAHPRWLATVLCNASTMVWPDASWSAGHVLPASDLRLPAEPRLPEFDANAPQFTGGLDRWPDLVHEDFFDDGWTLGDPEPGDGLAALTHLADLSTVVIPDLYEPEPLAPLESVLDIPASLAGATFAPCVDNEPPSEQAIPPAGLDGLALDPQLELAAIITLQKRVVELAETLRAFVVLLDVPPGLTWRQVLRWRAELRGSYAAAYHPWLYVAPDDDRRDAKIKLPPSAAAAGIIARQELAFGVPHGPAGVVAVGAIDLLEHVSPDMHAALHTSGVNVYVRERDGARLSAGRTLSPDPGYRQLSVRRLMLLLRRTLAMQAQWAVFEPNTPQLRRDLANALRAYLRELYRAGAFRGASETEAFFVRCDNDNNPRRDVDAGRLVAEVGVAPAEPLEFIVLRVVRGGDGTLAVEL